LEGILRDRSTAQGLDTDDLITLERSGTIDAQARSEDQYKSGTRQAPCKFSRVRSSKRTELDERTGHEKTVGEPNFNTSQKWCDTSSIGEDVTGVSSMPMKGSPLIGLIICTLSPEAEAIVCLLCLLCQKNHAKRVGQ
jgi:hypothetical protein